jgi:hypothetical protein
MNASEERFVGCVGKSEDFGGPAGAAGVNESAVDGIDGING